MTRLQKMRNSLAVARRQGVERGKLAVTSQYHEASSCNEMLLFPDCGGHHRCDCAQDDKVPQELNAYIHALMHAHSHRGMQKLVKSEFQMRYLRCINVYFLVVMFLCSFVRCYPGGNQVRLCEVSVLVLTIALNKYLETNILSKLPQ